MEKEFTQKKLTAIILFERTNGLGSGQQRPPLYFFFFFFFSFSFLPISLGCFTVSSCGAHEQQRKGVHHQCMIEPEKKELLT